MSYYRGDDDENEGGSDDEEEEFDTKEDRIIFLMDIRYNNIYYLYIYKVLTFILLFLENQCLKKIKKEKF
jgi:hypothetical protein